MKWRFISILMFCWFAAVTSSLLWNWSKVETIVAELASKEARSHYEKDQIIRLWGAMHGGVYVPPSEHTPPNPHLKFLKRRDVTTTSGMKLTLINPAYMTRQMYELAAKQHGVQGHITSLDPIRPENTPDQWEREALLAFEKGETERLAISNLRGEPYLRYMRPMIAKKPCLKCHEKQGYKEGDVRGGLAVSVPLKPYHEYARNQQQPLFVGHLAIGILGLIGLWAVGQRLRHSAEALQQAKVAAEHIAAKDELLLSNLGEGVYGVDPDGNCTFINPSALTMLQLSEEEVIGKDQHKVFHSTRTDGSTYAYNDCPVHKTLRDRHERKAEDAFLRNGQLFPVHLHVTPMTQNGELVGAVVVFQDISKQKAAEKQIHQLAYYDSLTELPNRALLLDRFNHAMSQAKRFRRSLAVLFLDLDHFKKINDTHGHTVGDELLVQAASKLINCVRKVDTVSRTGGDEFIILLSEIEKPDDAKYVAEKILEIFRGSIQTSELEIYITISIGIAIYNLDSDDDIEELMKNADKAMYEAKSAGRNCYKFHYS